MNYNNHTIEICRDNFFEILSECTTPFHTSEYAKKELSDAGFKKLNWNEEWILENNHGYYTCPFGTTTFAFTIGNINKSSTPSFKFVSSHIDSPCFRLKYNPDITSKNSHKLNVEVYGGAIYNTWLDRPLSIAGKLYLKSDTLLPNEKLIDFKRPVSLIPNLAIHLNRKINEGVSLNPQTDMMPVCSFTSIDNDSDYFLSNIAKQANVDINDILYYDLYLYNYEQPYLAGFDNDLIMSPRIDNISSVQASLYGLVNSKNTNTVNIITLFDHEEIGSRSKNGADSHLLSFLTERICNSLNISQNEYIKNINNNYFLSLDVAHAFNPNHPDKYDPKTNVTINNGFAVKCSAKHSYCTDGLMTGYIMQLCDKNNISYQINHMRSDNPGGSTVGPMVSSYLPMNCADAGIPILAMHSAMETAGINDQFALEEFVSYFFGV